MSTEKVRERILDIGVRVVAEHGEALKILDDHDPEYAQRQGADDQPGEGRAGLS